MSDQKKWIITTSGDQSLNDIIKNLREAGFAVSQVLDQIGCIVGTISDAEVSRIRAIPGVADVSPDAAIDIGPPDAPETW